MIDGEAKAPTPSSVEYVKHDGTERWREDDGEDHSVASDPAHSAGER
jgi:hypothetical protein